VAADYGVLTEGGIALRGLFLINPEGNVVYSVVHDLAVGRSVDETIRVLKAFQQVAKTGEVCPANWDSGKKTMKPDTQKSKKYFATAA
ncbi:MAG: peroxiredoxin, partial [Elusimicrobiota bacterium]